MAALLFSVRMRLSLLTEGANLVILTYQSDIRDICLSLVPQGASLVILTDNGDIRDVWVSSYTGHHGWVVRIDSACRSIGCRS